MIGAAIFPSSPQAFVLEFCGLPAQVSRSGDGPGVESRLRGAMAVRDYLRRFTSGSAPESHAALSEEAFRSLADGLAAMVVVFQDDTICLMNPAARAVTGFADEELLGRTFWDIVHPEHRELVRKRGVLCQQGPAPRSRHEIKLLTKAGRDVWVELTLSAVRFRSRWAGMLTAFDVTGRRLAEGAMRESERRFRDLLENVRLIAVTLDVEGVVTFANSYLLELVGAEEEDVVGHSWFDLFVPEEDRETARGLFLDRVKLGMISPHEEREIVTRLGERRQVSWNNTILHDYTGKVTGAASIGADVTERRHAEERLLHDAFHDPLTGLPNRALFMDRLASALARSKRRGGYLFAVLFLDLDRFKLVNDSLGHQLGDQFLLEIGRLLSALLRAGDTVARLGGDEFTLLLDDIQGPEDATHVAERVAETLDHPVIVGGQEVAASASIGITLSSAGYDQPEDMLRDADTAMYQAKASGKARHQVFDSSMYTRARRLLNLENSLRRAVDKGEFLMHYQPIVELHGLAVVGFEALARWEHPQRGLVAPGEWIRVAEEAGLIHRIGRWALLEACRQMRSWEDLVPPGFAVSVNLSSLQFKEDLVEEVALVLRETGVSPQRLKLEITESVLMENAEAAVGMLTQLRDLGARVCIDDFGSGYSSLSYLLRFPADTLKIDRSFISELGKSERNAKIVASIVSLGRSLGLEIVAEGVETEEQRLQLEVLGCQYGQGYLFAKPMDEARARGLLTDRLAVP
jgi:diguanylate cyclase (GGDEF)-like protein/PAS domain S-box-containing protein